MKRGSAEVVVYGRRAVREALATVEVDVEAVWATSRLAGPARREIAAASRARQLQIEEIHPREMQERGADPRNDQGVAARVRLSNLRECSAFAASQNGAARRKRERWIALDGITNSQNVGMIVRSAVAAGLDGVLWPLHDVPWINGLVVKASAGTILRAPIVRCEALPLALGELQGAGFEAIGLTARAPDGLFDHEPPQRAVYVVGSETQGLSPAVEAVLDQRLAIPMAEGVESLNVAVAGSLLCFQANRE